ncbi:MAG TPA: DUF2490 domain-containing protein [Pyrinomonadaceae bacterium]|nr:DUF2490 domain-containing protein [Pyrinomonadaceae bacterium]
MQKYCTSALAIPVLVLIIAGQGSSQTSSAATEVWPSVQVSFDPQPRIGVQLLFEKHNDEDVSRAQWKISAIASYRMKRILNRHRDDIDPENEYNLAVGGGYEYVRTEQTSGNKIEHRVIFQTIPKYVPFWGILVQDRSRAEFRWVDDVYNFRYRNRLTVDREFKLNKVRLTPYVSGELFWDRNHHAWTENQYKFGVQLPYKKLLMLDTYYLRQNFTTCSQDPLSVFGIRLNLYFKRKRK